MHFQYSSSRILHEDHMASLAMLSDVERLVLARKTAPARDDNEFGRFAARLRGALEGEIPAHFDFEDDTLFPILIQSGEADLVDLLAEEHVVLREVMRDVAARAKDAAPAGFSAEGWAAFRGLCGEFIERLQSHVEKEERALIPAMETVLTAEVDAEASARHDM